MMKCLVCGSDQMVPAWEIYASWRERLDMCFPDACFVTDLIKSCNQGKYTHMTKDTSLSTRYPGAGGHTRGLQTAKTMMALIILFSAITAAIPGPAHPSEVVEFLGGVAATYSVHEFGHMAAAVSSGANLHWEIQPGNRCIGFEEDRELNHSDGTLLYASGLLVQAISAELVLQSDLDKNSSFVRGAMAWNIINPIKYTLTYWALNNQGDIKGIEHYAGKESADFFAAAMAGIALHQGVRFLRTQSWAPAWAKQDRFHFAVIPTGNHAFVASFSARF